MVSPEVDKLPEEKELESILDTQAQTFPRLVELRKWKEEAWNRLQAQFFAEYGQELKELKELEEAYKASEERVRELSREIFLAYSLTRLANGLIQVQPRRRCLEYDVEKAIAYFGLHRPDLLQLRKGEAERVSIQMESEPGDPWPIPTGIVPVPVMNFDKVLGTWRIERGMDNDNPTRCDDGEGGTLL